VLTPQDLSNEVLEGPRNLVSLALISRLEPSPLKKSPTSLTPKRHCRVLFMKQVLPRLERPTRAFLPPAGSSEERRPTPALEPPRSESEQARVDDPNRLEAADVVKLAPLPPVEKLP